VILADTSVWVDHLRGADAVLTGLLQAGRVLAHPFVTGELALGNLRQRDPILALLQELPRAIVASDDEVLHFIKRHALFGLGVGYVDVHLLASARLTPGASLWTRDNRLLAVATRQALAANVAH
jgi:hypothetical protein